VLSINTIRPVIVEFKMGSNLSVIIAHTARKKYKKEETNALSIDTKIDHLG